jgi:hypothetical protein
MTRTGESEKNLEKEKKQMTKRMLILGVVLALVAGMIIPAAVLAAPGNTTDVTGNIVGATITISAPSPINLGMLVWGDNTGNSTGSVNITPNSRNPSQSDWQVTAVDAKTPNKGYMTKTGPVALGNELAISPDNSTWNSADTTATWTGNTSGTHSIPFYVKQTISAVEATGNYTITITFTASITLGGN